MRARLAIRSSQQRCQLREVVLRNKPDALFQASAKGTVPVLVLSDGTVIDESRDIMLWALSQHDPDQWLDPQQGSLAQMQDLITENDTVFKAHLDRYKYPGRFELDSGLEDRDAGARWLRGLDQRLGSAPYLFGQHPALADMAIAPFVRQYAHTDRDWFRAQDWAALCDWLDVFLGHPYFADVMQKYAPWDQAQPETVLFPPSV